VTILANVMQPGYRPLLCDGGEVCEQLVQSNYVTL